MAVIKMARINTWWQGYGEKGTLVHSRYECKLVQSPSKTVWSLLIKLGIELPDNPAIPCLGIYPKNTRTPIQKDTHTPLFITASFTRAKTWKQPKCPLSNGDEDIKDTHMYGGVSFVAQWLTKLTRTHENVGDPRPRSVG